MLTYNHARQHHTYTVRNAQLAHDDWGKQDNQQHHEKDERWVRNGEIGSQSRHSVCKGTKK